MPLPDIGSIRVISGWWLVVRMAALNASWSIAAAMVSLSGASFTKRSCPRL